MSDMSKDDLELRETIYNKLQYCSVVALEAVFIFQLLDEAKALVTICIKMIFFNCAGTTTLVFMSILLFEIEDKITSPVRRMRKITS